MEHTCERVSPDHLETDDKNTVSCILRGNVSNTENKQEGSDNEMPKQKLSFSHITFEDLPQL